MQGKKISQVTTKSEEAETTTEAETTEVETIRTKMAVVVAIAEVEEAEIFKEAVEVAIKAMMTKRK